MNLRLFCVFDGLHKVKWVEQTMKLIAPDSTRSDLFGSSVHYTVIPH